MIDLGVEHFLLYYLAFKMFGIGTRYNTLYFCTTIATLFYEKNLLIERIQIVSDRFGSRTLPTILFGIQNVRFGYTPL